jgi:hypothetical protein
MFSACSRSAKLAPPREDRARREPFKLGVLAREAPDTFLVRVQADQLDASQASANSNKTSARKTST